MTIDDIAARHAAALAESTKLVGYVNRCDSENEVQRLGRGRKWFSDFRENVPYLLDLVANQAAEITKLTAALADAEARGRLAERARIIDALKYEASVRPCAEDAGIVSDCALLIEADFSYDKAEEIENALAQSPEDGKQASTLSTSREGGT